MRRVLCSIYTQKQGPSPDLLTNETAETRHCSQQAAGAWDTSIATFINVDMDMSMHEHGHGMGMAFGMALDMDADHTHPIPGGACCHSPLAPSILLLD